MNLTATNNYPQALICFSHLRWDFVYQRPQHLLSRVAEKLKVYYVEEPVHDADEAHYSFHDKLDNLTVLVPHLPAGVAPAAGNEILMLLLDGFMHEIDLSTTAFWYYTPMALSFSRHLRPQITIFDCMDELSAFKFAPQDLKDLEQELLERADLVFTGGASLYNAKKSQHHNIHLFPSSIDKAHFGKSRLIQLSPEDQQQLPFPRLGFFGVIDERFDTGLLQEIALNQPEWQFIIIGPVVKIDPAMLPRQSNIHYLGPKPYSSLPDYLAGWDIALIPFALNESTRFISPTKTPEYLAAGKRVISTPLIDVIDPYGQSGLVDIAVNAGDFIAAAERIFEEHEANSQWLKKVDDFLKDHSWDVTFAGMLRCIQDVLCANEGKIPGARVIV